jgi:hypothetical protein
MGQGLDGSVTAFAVFLGQLIAGGTFAGSRACRFGTEPPGSRLWSWTDGAVHALLATEDQLIVAGDFDYIEDQHMGNVVGWDGVSWTTFGLGLEWSVDAIAMYRGAPVVTAISGSPMATTRRSTTSPTGTAAAG